MRPGDLDVPAAKRPPIILEQREALRASALAVFKSSQFLCECFPILYL